MLHAFSSKCFNQSLQLFTLDSRPCKDGPARKSARISVASSIMDSRRALDVGKDAACSESWSQCLFNSAWDIARVPSSKAMTSVVMTSSWALARSKTCRNFCLSIFWVRIEIWLMTELKSLISFSSSGGIFESTPACQGFEPEVRLQCQIWYW